MPAKRPTRKAPRGAKAALNRTAKKRAPANQPADKRPLRAAKRKATRPDGTAYTTTSTFSPRLLDLHASLDAHLRRLFRDVEPRYDFDMYGWRVRRPVPVAQWTGTIDPNFLHIYLAERKQGLTLHVWDPTEPATLKHHRATLEAAGFKVMVGCLNFNRKGEFPLGPVVDLLKAAKARMDAER